MQQLRFSVFVLPMTQETKLCTVICPTYLLLTEERSARGIRLHNAERLDTCLKRSVHSLFLLWIHYETESSSISHCFSFNYPVCADAKRPTVRTEVEYGSGQAQTLFRRPFFIGSGTDFALPPTQDSQATKAELAYVHRVEQTRTPEQVAAAQADDREEDLFIFTHVIGSRFTKDDLPLTAALSARVHNDEAVISEPLKGIYNRPASLQLRQQPAPRMQDRQGAVVSERAFDERLSIGVHNGANCAREEARDS